MTPRILAGLFLAGLVLLVGASPAWNQERKAARLVKLAPQAEKKPASSLAYRLLPDPLDQVEGNAAVLWYRAVTAARSVRYKWTEKEWQWDHPDGTALDKLPVKQVKEALEKHAAALRLAGQAALRTRCDWGLPAPTIQNLATDIPLDEIQGMRQLAHLLNLRCRLALAQGNFPEALETLQTGFTLVRHLSESNQLLLQDLVAIAIATIMAGRLEEWVQIPGSPNLYWALTDLPRPLLDIRRSFRSELNTIYRSFPALRELKKGKLTAEEARRLAEKAFTACAPGMEKPGGLTKAAAAALASKYHAAAKKALIASGRPAKEVEAMSAVQAVALHYLEDYDRARDEILQWLAVPAWQGRAHLEKVEAAYRKRAGEDGNVFIKLLMPALMKVSAAHLRLGRHLAGLRGAEALRLYVAAHGKPPAKWGDLTVPGPLDPFTGKGFDSWYRLSDGTGVLDVPPPPHMPASLGRRYEAAGGKKGAAPGR
jgi:hypothetical protein